MPLPGRSPLPPVPPVRPPTGARRRPTTSPATPRVDKSLPLRLLETSPTYLHPLLDSPRPLRLLVASPLRSPSTSERHRRCIFVISAATVPSTRPGRAPRHRRGLPRLLKPLEGAEELCIADHVVVFLGLPAIPFFPDEHRRLLLLLNYHGPFLRRAVSPYSPSLAPLDSCAPVATASAMAELSSAA